MKKIAYVLPYLCKGGTETHVLDLIKGFRDKYDITLVAPRGPRLQDFLDLKINYLPITGLGSNFWKGIRDYKHVLTKLDEKNIDLIHVHAGHEYVLLTGLFLKKVPLIFTGHSYPNRFNYRLSSFINNHFANEVICVSDAEYSKFTAGKMKAEKLHRIYNGISIPKNCSTNKEIRKKVGSDKKIIGTVARLERDKGVHILLEAFKNLNNPDTHLLFVGDGQLEDELKTRVKEYGLSKKVTFTGFVRNIHDYYQTMNLFVLPSLKDEACSLVILEAMAHGLPVIATDVGGAGEQVADGRTGKIIPPDDINSLTSTLKKFINDSSLVKNMGDNGLKRFEQYFDVKIMLKETEKIYNKYLKKL